MNKLNGLGQELLSYKKELLREDYPAIVKKSLEIAVNKMAEDNVIGIDIHYDLIHNDITMEQLNELLLKSKTCMKTAEELLSEYEVLREALNSELGKEIHDDTVNTISDIKNEKIIIIKEFLLDKEFAREYFGVDEHELNDLMMRKGLLEKFAILRLNKILGDFIEQHYIKDEALFDIALSEVFYESSEEAYGIHLMFKIPVETLEESEKIPQISFQAKELISDADKYYSARVLA